jgi:hypothetical protein
MVARNGGANGVAATVDSGGAEQAFAEQVELRAAVFCRLSILIRLTVPSTGSELWGRVRPAVTAARSVRRPATNERSVAETMHQAAQLVRQLATATPATHHTAPAPPASTQSTLLNH